MPRTRAAVVVALASLLAAVGCSGSGSGDAKRTTTTAAATSAVAALAELGITDAPSVVLATGVEQTNPTSRLGAEMNRAYLRFVLAVQGYSWSDADCAARKLVAMVGADGFAKQTIRQVQLEQQDVSGGNAAARTCASAESLARLDQKSSGTSGRSAHPALDIDGGAVRSILETLYRADSQSVGLTAAETDCVVKKVLDPLSSARLVQAATGEKLIKPTDTAGQVASCVSSKRMDTLAPATARQLLDQQQAARAEHERLQASINARIDQANTTTTTTTTA